jgi:hypothetical protein
MQSDEPRFENFSDPAKRVLAFAREEAETRNRNDMTTGHLLMGLIRGRTYAVSNALELLDVELDQLSTLVGAGMYRGENPPTGRRGFTLQTKRVLDLSRNEATALGARNVGPEHILLALIREGGDAMSVLFNHGPALDKVRERIIHVQGAAEVPRAESPHPLPPRVFISYRREDGSHIAGRIYDWLIGQLGDGQVFMDVDSIELGLDFKDVITDAIGRCDLLVAVIGRQWATARDAAGHLRLADEDDLVRLEIEAALGRSIRVIPVLVDDAEMPTREQLPESLRALVRRNALKVRHDSFRPDVRRLLGVVEQRR